MLLHNTLQREEIDQQIKCVMEPVGMLDPVLKPSLPEGFNFFLGQNDSYSDAVMKQNHKH